MVFLQYGNLLAIRNRRVSLLQSNPLWGPRKNLFIPMGMVGTALIAVVNLYGRGLQKVFSTTPIPAMFWGPPFAFAVGTLCMDEARKAIVRGYPNVSLPPTLFAVRHGTDWSWVVDRGEDGVVTRRSAQCVGPAVPA